MSLLLAGGYGWYRVQDRETQVKAEEHLLTVLDWGRNNRSLPYEVRLVFDQLAERVPLTIGHTVDVVVFDGDNTIIYGGAPGSLRTLRVLQNEGFVVGYDELRRSPAWVAYRVFDPGDRRAGERPERFEVDTRTRAQVSPEEYTHTGFDRGHMAPNHAIALLYGDQAQEQTFLMSNIVPQSPDLNRKVWRDLEARILRSYASRFEEVWVITGPIYPQGQAPDILGDGVAIPEACFKIVIDEHEKGLRAQAFIVPQNVSGDEQPAEFLVSIRDIENRTGLDFLPNLPSQAQDSLETYVSARLW